MNEIKIVHLSGTKYEMGIDYGRKLQAELKASLSILINYFCTNHQISFETLVNKAYKLYYRYPDSYKKFIEGITKSTGLSLDEVIVLNGMETLPALINAQFSEITACSFISIPPSKTASGTNLLGRNYDFPEPFNLIAKYLTVTVLNEPGTIPTAIIAMPGQIYCPTCINKNSLFIELNNGMPSGGFETNEKRESLLIKLLEIAQTSKNFTELDTKLLAANSDYSLIINIADKTSTKSFEYSSFLGSKAYIPTANTFFASTNFYLNNSWVNLPTPTDLTTWYGVTRRNNLLELGNKHTIKFTTQNLMDILDLSIEEGGTSWGPTIYKIIFDSSNNDLYLKVIGDENWTHITDIFG